MRYRIMFNKLLWFSTSDNNATSLTTYLFLHHVRSVLSHQKYRTVNVDDVIVLDVTKESIQRDHRSSLSHAGAVVAKVKK